MTSSRERLKTRMVNLEADWDSYGAEPPNDVALLAAVQVLDDLASINLDPTSIDPSVEGGICLSFQRGERYGDIECFNTGEILAVTSTGYDTKVWTVKDNVRSAIVIADYLGMSIEPASAY